MQACTIIARNYLAQARVLARSFKKHHPDSPFTVLIVDQGSDRVVGEAFAILGIEDLGLAAGEAERMALIYDVLELSTALKPWFLRRLLRDDPDVVIYFDADIEIFAPLSDVADLAREHLIVLTPHVLQPMPRDSLRPAETDILAVGVYNLGFIAVGTGSETFLDWWAVRLRRESHIDPAKMRFTDQRWVDFVPALFSHYILRDPTCNAAYWNLDQRKLTQTATGYEVNGRPLRFFHYSGYEPHRPDVLSKFQGDAPRVHLRGEPAIAAICDEYRRQLLAAGYDECRRVAYRYNSFGSGVPVDPAIRMTYRAALLKFETGEGPEPPNAFDPGKEDAFLQWLTEPLESETALITRYMLGVWENRQDVQTLFPDPRGSDAAAFYEWFVSNGRHETKCHPSLLATLDAACDSNLAASLRLATLQRGSSAIGKTIDFGARGNSEPYRLSGWGLTERHFTWSIGGSATIALPIPARPGPLELQVFTGALNQRPKLVTQHVDVYVRDLKVAEWNVGDARLFHAKIPAEATDSGGLLTVQFRTPDAVAPRELLPANEDARLLGLCVYRMRLFRTSDFRRLLRRVFPRWGAR